MTDQAAGKQNPRAPAPAPHSLADLQHLPATDFAPLRTAIGRAWIASLPARVDKIASSWDLVVHDDHIRNGYSAVVVPVERGGRPLSLKLAWPARQALAEAAALAAWNGRGSVELVRSAPRQGALLLERLDASRPLSRLPLADAARVTGELIRTLAIAPPATFLATQQEARQLTTSLRQRQRELDCPVPPAWIQLATGAAATLAESRAAVLVHADLHYDNILASYRAGRPWIAIDPSARTGDPERSVPELLWTRADELGDGDAILALLDLIADAGQLNRDKAAAWAFVRAIDYWLWALQHGLTIDPLRCERIAAALVARCRHACAARS
jgi:streptomycin 6-kinase